jgi:predicted hydrocarbon binding protein
MSLVLESGGLQRQPPSLIGEELLSGADPSSCMVSGVMFAARKQLLVSLAGDPGFYEVVSRLSPATMQSALHPVAGTWVPFAALVELDKAIHARMRERYPHILTYVGAASAELGISRVYRELDVEELVTFLGSIARFHHQYQNYGVVEFERTPNGARMRYLGYPCYSRYFCASGDGFFLEAILRHGGKHPDVHEVRCHCWGDGVCEYEMTWR